MQLANGSGCEHGEARFARRCERPSFKPRREAVEFERHRREYVLQLGLRQPAIARLAQTKGAHALRERALKAGPQSLERSLRSLRLAGSGQGLVGPRVSPADAARAGVRRRRLRAPRLAPLRPVRPTHSLRYPKVCWNVSQSCGGGTWWYVRATLIWPVASGSGSVHPATAQARIHVCSGSLWNLQLRLGPAMTLR